MTKSINVSKSKKVIIDSTISVSGNQHIGDVNNYYTHPAPFTPPALPERPPLHLPRQILKKQESGIRASIFGGPNGCNLLEELEKHRLVVLLGDAGMGKSTELKWFCHELKESGKWRPIFKSLGNKKHLEDLYAYLENFEGDIVLVLDGLDESNIHDAKTAIEAFVNTHSNAKILVSSRSNAYAEGGLQGFQVYYLANLAYPQIKQYTEEKLGHFSEAFLDYWNQKHQWNQALLISNPFFLVHICEYVVDKGNKLPDSLSDVFEYLIEKSFDARLPNLSSFGEGDLTGTRKLYRQLLEKLAFVMESQGENVISKADFAQLIPDKQQRDELLGKSSLLEKQEDAWRFAHNNFQEYLAAKALSRAANLEAIKKAIAAKPDFQRLKWTWVNALSFLMSLWDGSHPIKTQLLDWLEKEDLEPLIKLGSLEKEKISLADRERIFRAEFEKCKVEDLIVGSHHYGYWDLAAFGESGESIRYLMDELRNGKTTTVRSNALLLLRNMSPFKVPNDIKAALRETIFSNIYDFDENTPAVRHFAMEACFQLFDIAPDEANKIVETFFDSKNAQERTSTYVLIDKQRLQTGFMNRLIHRAVGLDDDNWRGEVRLADEGYHLEKCFENLETDAEIIAFFEAFTQEIEDWHDGRRTELPLSKLLEKAMHCSVVAANRIFDLMKQMFYNWVSYHDSHCSLVLRFIEKHNIQNIFFQYCIDIKGFQMVAVEFLNEKNLDYLIEKLKSGHLDWQYMHNFIGWVNSQKRGLIHQFIEKLNEVSDEPIKVPELQIPITQEEHSRRQKQKILFEKTLFLDKSLCLATIKRFFSEIGKDIVEKSEIWEIRRLKRGEIDDLNEHFPYYLLQRLNGMAPTSKRRVLRTIKENWTWISISETREYLKRHKKEIEANPELGLNDLEFAYVKAWCDEHQSKINLNERMTNGDIAFAWFVVNLRFTHYPQSLYLQLAGSKLQNHSEENLLEFLSKQHVVPFQQLKDYILNIMGTEDVDGWRAYNYLKFIEENPMPEAVPILQRYIEHRTEYSDNRDFALRIYIAKGGDAPYLLHLLKSITPTPDDYREQTLLDHFSKKPCEEFEKILLRKLASSADTEQQLTYARYLVREGNLVGLQFLADYIERERKSPFSAHIGNRDMLFENPMGIPILLRFFDYGNDSDIPQDSFNSIASVGRNMLLHLASCKGGRYFETACQAIRDYLNSQDEISAVSERGNALLRVAQPEALRQLRYLLKQLEFNHYQKQPVDLHEAIDTWQALS